jgi:hypothetical protein
MSWEVAKLCSERKFGSPVRKQIIMFLADKASDDGSGIWCSKGTIHRHTELGESTVKRAVNELVHEGILIETGQHRRCKHGYTVVYHMNLTIVQTLELISEPEEKIEYPTGSRADGVHIEPGTGSRADGEPGPERPPNNPKTIPKPPTRANAPEGEDTDFDAAWSAYPADRLRNKASCHQEFLRGVEAGVTAEELIEAVGSYASETAGYTRSKVCFSDNWFRERRWQRYVEEARKAQIEKGEREVAYLIQLAESVRARDWMCAHISIAQAGKLLLRGLVSEDDLRLAGVAY